jgi:hypothetical protein
MARKNALTVNISPTLKALVTKRRAELERQDGIYRSESAYVLALIKRDLGLVGADTAEVAILEDKLRKAEQEASADRGEPREHGPDPKRAESARSGKPASRG